MKEQWVLVFESDRDTNGETETFTSPPETSRDRAIEDARRLHLSPVGGTLIRVEGSNGETLALPDLEALWSARGS